MTSDDLFVDVGRERYATGLLVPDERPQRLTRYAESQPILGKDEIRALVESRSRSMGRDRFGQSYIRNQGGRGSCNGYAGAKATERAREIRGGIRIPLSGEGLYAQINGGRDGGSMLDDGMRTLTENGVPPEELVAHETYRWDRVSQEAKDSCPRFRLHEAYGVDTEIELASGLALGFVGVVAVHASNRWSRLDARGVAGESHGPGNHSVGVDEVQIIDGDFAFDMFNSWGTRWGQQGRCYLMWNLHFSRTINYHDFYLIRSTIDDPENPPPAPDGDQQTSDVTVIVKKSDGCGWCQQWSRHEKPRAKAKGWTVDEQLASGSVPRFIVRVGGRQSEELTGFTEVDDLEAIANKLKA